jgi:hypothetical protein
MKEKGVYGQKTGGLLLMAQCQGQGQAACGLVNSRPYSNFPVRALSDPPTKEHRPEPHDECEVYPTCSIVSLNGQGS